MKIALTGPESTGKSDTARFLAGFFKAREVPEMARIYIDQLNRPYVESDLLEIAKIQCAEEDRAGAGEELVICDTTLLVIKVWSYFKYKRCHPWIEEEYLRRKYTLHLLCYIDLPWIQDNQREHLDRREELFNIYHSELIKSGSAYEILTGKGDERKSRAIQFVQNAIQNQYQ